ncbi:MAG: biotin--[acetyl-CoA-carboxylase] ligase [Gammaproteobacteria bacterium]|nr:biotin--[acetyl-CoA-carboxylase] ligase [Gammaproteobacteria bacterium]
MSHHHPERINALLARAGVAAAGRVSWFGEIDSTNTWLMRQPEVHARVCLAEWQSAGRGRRGRSWRAPRSSAVLLSIGWNLGGANAAGLSLVSGLAVVAALRRAGIHSVGLKWPNDVMVRSGKMESKLGGVLTELSGTRCVVGVGINVKMPASDCAAPGRADLQSLGYAADRDQLAADLIIAHCRHLQRFCRLGLAPFVDEWNRLHVHRDRAVSVRLPRELLHGIARGIDRHGALTIDQDGGRRRIISGQASVRAREQVSQTT